MLLSSYNSNLLRIPSCPIVHIEAKAFAPVGAVNLAHVWQWEVTTQTEFNSGYIFAVLYKLTDYQAILGVSAGAGRRQ